MSKTCTPEWKRGTADARKALIQATKEWADSGQSVKQLLFRLKTTKVNPQDVPETQ